MSRIPGFTPLWHATIPYPIGLGVAVLMAFSPAAEARPTTTGPGICQYEEIADMDVLGPGLTGGAFLIAIDAAANRAFVLGAGGCNDFPLFDGGAPVALDAPSGIAVDENGRIYVSDTGNDRILVFSDPAGLDSTDALDLVEIFSLPSTGLSLSEARGLGHSGDGRLYIADTGAGRVQVADSIGQLVGTIGGPDDGDPMNGINGEFITPSDVAVCPASAPGDLAGRVFVADQGRDDVQAFDADGTYLFRFGRTGDGRGELQSPVGIAVDHTCNVYVADRGNARVQMFDGDGGFLEILGGVSTTSAVAVDPRDTQGGVHAASDGQDAITTFLFIDYDIDFNGNADNDGDGLPDIWEEEGIDTTFDGTIDFVLPGADLDRKNLYLEIDFTEGQSLPEADLDPEAGDAADYLIAAFANAPVSNPDGSTGIDLHIERGEEGPFDGELLAFDVDPASVEAFPDAMFFFDNIKRELFGTPAERAAAPQVLDAKSLAYRYALVGASVCGVVELENGDPVCTEPRPYAGIAELPGDDLIVTPREEAGIDMDNGGPGGLGEAGGDSTVPFEPVEPAQRMASLLMHEFGHTLNLRHGGNEEENCKPNYVSVMNYTLKTGIRTDDPAHPYGARFDYSAEVLDTLDEQELDETVGIGLLPLGPDGTFTDKIIWGGDGNVGLSRGDLPIDWDFDDDGATDTSAMAEINMPGLDLCAGDASELTGHDDWANLLYSSRHSGSFGVAARGEITENEASHADLDALDALYDSFDALPYAWAAKFLCVPLVGPEATALSPGRYQTTVNVLNPGREDARLRKGISIARNELDPRGPITPLEDDLLGPREALSIDCTSLATRFDEAQAVGDGFVLLQSDQVLDVVAVYTSRDSVDVELIPVTEADEGDMPEDGDPDDRDPGGEDPGGEDPRGDLPDLTIELPEPTREACTDSGSACELFVQFLVSNTGAADTGAGFDVTVSLSNGQTATVTIPALNAGASALELLQLPFGPPCYTPTCTTTAIVDALDEIEESAEDNNVAVREDT